MITPEAYSQFIYGALLFGSLLTALLIGVCLPETKL